MAFGRFRASRKIGQTLPREYLLPELPARIHTDSFTWLQARCISLICWSVT
jgi:hypothetical protein